MKTKFTKMTNWQFASVVRGPQKGSEKKGYMVETEGKKHWITNERYEHVTSAPYLTTEGKEELKSEVIETVKTDTIKGTTPKLKQSKVAKSKKVAKKKVLTKKKVK